MNEKIMTEYGEITDPLRFLESVMNDESVQMRDRADAAAALASFLYGDTSSQGDNDE